MDFVNDNTTVNDMMNKEYNENEGYQNRDHLLTNNTFIPTTQLSSNGYYSKGGFKRESNNEEDKKPQQFPYNLKKWGYRKILDLRVIVKLWMARRVGLDTESYMTGVTSEQIKYHLWLKMTPR